MLGSVEATSAGPGSALIIGMSSRAPLPQPVRAMIRIRCSQSAHTTRRLFGVVGLRSRYPKALVGSRNRCRRVRPGRVNRPARRAVRAPSAARIRRLRARPRCRVCRDRPRPTGRTTSSSHPTHSATAMTAAVRVFISGQSMVTGNRKRPRGFPAVGAEPEEAGAVFADRAGLQGGPLPCHRLSQDADAGADRDGADAADQGEEHGEPDPAALPPGVEAGPAGLGDLRHTDTSRRRCRPGTQSRTAMLLKSPPVRTTETFT